MEQKTQRRVSYARSTYRKSKEFSEGLEELGKRIPPALMRYYYMTGIKSPEYEEALYQEIDALFAIRESGITGEMKYVIAQAQINGAVIPQEALGGRSLQIAFPELEEKAPSLGVYRLFMPFTVAEFQEPEKSTQTQDSD